MLLKPAPDDYTSRHPLPDDVFLLIEVSDSTLDYGPDRKNSRLWTRGRGRGVDCEPQRTDH